MKNEPLLIVNIGEAVEEFRDAVKRRMMTLDRPMTALAQAATGRNIVVVNGIITEPPRSYKEHILAIEEDAEDKHEKLLKDDRKAFLEQKNGGKRGKRW